jgi:hypothetical protein
LSPSKVGAPKVTVANTHSVTHDVFSILLFYIIFLSIF